MTRSLTRATGRAIIACAALLPAAALAADHLAEGERRLAAGDLRNAQIEFRNAVRAAPDDARAHYSLGSVDLALGDASAAEREGRAAAEHGYAAPEAAALLAEAYLGEGRFRDLLRDFPADAASAAEPATRLLTARGSAQLALGDPEAAQASFAAAERLTPRSPALLLAQARLALARNDAGRAMERLDQALAANPHLAEALLRKAQLLAARGDHDAALALLDDTVRRSPGLLGARLERAALLIAAGRDAEGKADVDAALAMAPGTALGIYYRAVLLARAHDWREADAALARLSPVMGRLSRAYYVAAVVKHHLGQTEQALGAATHYAARVPGDAAGARLLARLLLANRRPAEAAEALGRFHAVAPGDAETYGLLGRAYQESGQPDAALAALEKAKALAPARADVLAAAGRVRLGLGDAEAAAGDLARALELTPGDPQLATALVVADLARGEPGRASEVIERLRRAGGDAVTLTYLGGLLDLQRLDLAAARQAFEGVLKSRADDVPARLNLARVAALQGSPDEATTLLADVLQREPANEAALATLMPLLFGAGRQADAIAALARAVQEAPADAALAERLGLLQLQAGDAAAALALARREEQTAASKLPFLLLRARAEVALAQPADAIETCRQAVALAPAAIEPRRRLATLLLAAGDLDGARGVLQDGLALAPQSAPLLQARVGVELKAGGLEAGLAEAGRLRRGGGEAPAARVLRGDLYMSVRRYADAISAYAAELRAGPDTTLVLRLASAESAAGQSDAARLTLRDWLARRPADASTARALAALDMAGGRLDDAATHLSTVLAAEPNDAASLNNLAWIYQQKSDGRARAYASRAYMLSPGPQVADTLGWILAAGDDPADGVALLREAASRLPGNPTVQYHLAVGYARSGHREDALRVLRPLVAGEAEFADKAEARRLLAAWSQAD